MGFDGHSQSFLGTSKIGSEYSNVKEIHDKSSNRPLLLLLIRVGYL